MPTQASEEPGTLQIGKILSELFPDNGCGEPVVAALAGWIELLQKWNRKIDLTAARSNEELFDLFIADAVVLHCARRELAQSLHWIDVGTGAGAPGLAMAVMDPTLRMDLVEPSAKRVAFLRQVVGRLGLGQVRVHCARVEDLQISLADDVVSRATWAPESWLAHGMPLTRRRLWMLLAREDWQPASNLVVEYDRTYHWPLTRAQRRIVAVSRA